MVSSKHVIQILQCGKNMLNGTVIVVLSDSSFVVQRYPLTLYLIQGFNAKKVNLEVYCSVLSLGGNVNTRQMSKPEMGSIFHINNQ